MRITSNHWGIGVVKTDGDQITGVASHPTDPDPSALNDNMVGSLNGSARILNPAVRASWLDGKRRTWARSVRRGKLGKGP